MSQVVSVSRLVNYMKRSIENDSKLRTLMVSGEISNFTKHRSGHLYFSLKDEHAKMNCVMFRTHAVHLQMPVKEGMKVIVTCSVSMYEPQGTIQLYVSAMQSDGIGDLYLAFEALKKKLFQEGLFAEEHKQPIPTYPLDIAVISAKTGAALQDVLAIMQRRWPIAKITLYPSLVQGASASVDLIRSLKKADEANHEIILLVRGGGSIEDLWCFNDEALAHTIYDAKTCIVSGVGHEVDTTLVDYVSDARAATPSAAAELVTPNILDVEFKLHQLEKILYQSIHVHVDTQRRKIDDVKNVAIFKNPDQLFQNNRLKLMMNINRLSRSEVYFKQKVHELDQKRNRLLYTAQLYLEQHKKHFTSSIMLLDAYNPLAILKRGYSVVLDENKHVIDSIKRVQVHEQIQIKVQDGILLANIEEIKDE